MVTPTDIRASRASLVRRAKRKPTTVNCKLTTVNRKLAALRAYFALGKAHDARLDELPTDGVERTAEQPAGPR